MPALTDLDPARLVAGHLDWGDDTVAARLAAHPLDALETEYPHYVREVDGPGAVDRPRDQHPVFYGCYDWHSAVHSHWALVRQLRSFDDHPDEAEIVASIDDRLTPENVAQEVAYLEANPAFEKPYGWAWLLHLGAEIRRWDDPRGDAWQETLEPLESTVRDLVAETVLDLPHPFRVGTHGNSAFALHCALDYARSVDDAALADAVETRAREWYADDASYPLSYEPLGWDFLSPGLTEADLMRRVLDGATFVDWLTDFLPTLETTPERPLVEAKSVESDPDEGVALHLVGLNLARAWALAGVADALAECDDTHPALDSLRTTAHEHAALGVSQAFTDEYAGSHWLSSFVLYLVSRNEGGIGVKA